MSTVIKSIEVDVPASTAFRELTRFEDLPRFMRGVVAVQQIDDRRLSWRAQIFGAERVWELEITEIAHEHELAWVSRSGPKNHGALVLESLSPASTRVTMQIHFDPAGFVEGVTDWSDTDAVVAAFADDPAWQHLHSDIEWDWSALEFFGIARGFFELAVVWRELVEVWESYVYEMREYWPAPQPR